MVMNTRSRKQISLLFLFVFLCVLKTGQAAHDSTKQDWEVTQRCLGDLPYPTIPQSKWDFSGVIFTENSHGVHALRTDVEQPYFVAMDSGSSFALDGAFSPDGRWFAYPKGVTQYNNLTSNFVSVDEIEVVSTDSRHTIYTIPWRTFTYSGVTRGLKPIVWLDNEHFLAEGELGNGGGFVNPFTGETQAWDKNLDLDKLYDFSPDFTRAFQWDHHVDLITRLADLSQDRVISPMGSSESGFQFLAWLPDSSSFIANTTHSDSQSNPVSSLELFDHDGNPQAEIFLDGVYNVSISQDSNKVAFLVNNQLFVADMKAQTVTDLCFTMRGLRSAWSPDNVNLAFTYDGYPIILNSDTLEMQILRYQTGEIMGWYPLD
jgi:hypothetical protein